MLERRQRFSVWDGVKRSIVFWYGKKKRFRMSWDDQRMDEGRMMQSRVGRPNRAGFLKDGRAGTLYEPGINPLTVGRRSA